MTCSGIPKISGPGTFHKLENSVSPALIKTTLSPPSFIHLLPIWLRRILVYALSEKKNTRKLQGCSSASTVTS